MEIRFFNIVVRAGTVTLARLLPFPSYTFFFDLHNVSVYHVKSCYLIRWSRVNTKQKTFSTCMTLRLSNHATTIKR